MAKKSTKRALTLSVLSLLLCVAMLAGTTFAWFTDSVTSGQNRIVAGNLDVELEYMTAATGATWTDANKDVTATPHFFVQKDGSDILWEPGVMSYANFRVKNVGDLALTYALRTLKAGYNTLEGHDLSEVIKFAVIEGTVTPDRDAVAAMASSNFDDFTSFAQSGWLAPVGNSNGDLSESTFTVVAYWKPNVKNDNDYNVNNTKSTSDGEPLWIDIEIQLTATQKDYEDDSFDNTYDQGLTPAGFTTPAMSKPASGDLTLGDKTIKVVIPAADMDDDTSDTKYKYQLKVEPDETPAGITIETNDTAVTYDISVLKTTAVTSGGTTTETTAPIGTVAAPITVKVFVGTGYGEVRAYHNGSFIPSADYSYDATTGYVTITTTSFSPFTFVCKPIVPTPKPSATASLVENSTGAKEVQFTWDETLTQAEAYAKPYGEKAIEIVLVFDKDVSTTLSISSSNFIQKADPFGIRDHDNVPGSRPATISKDTEFLLAWSDTQSIIQYYTRANLSPISVILSTADDAYTGMTAKVYLYMYDLTIDTTAGTATLGERILLASQEVQF